MVNFEIIEDFRNNSTNDNYLGSVNITNVVQYTHNLNPFEIDCNEIASNITLHLLSSYAKCYLKLKLECDDVSFDDNYNSYIKYNEHNNITIEDFSILIKLSGYSTIGTSNSLFVSDNIVDFVCNSIFGCNYNNNPNISIVNPFNSQNSYIINEIDILNTSTAITPQVTISNFQHTIGICDDLILDARNSYNLGGRPASFTWVITPIVDMSINNDTELRYDGLFHTVTALDLHTLWSQNDNNDTAQRVFNVDLMVETCIIQGMSPFRVIVVN